MQLVSAHPKDNIFANVICFLVVKITLVIEVIVLSVGLGIRIARMILKKSNTNLLNILSYWVDYSKISSYFVILIRA